MPTTPNPFHVNAIANYCQTLASTTGNSYCGAVREFIFAHTRHPTTISDWEYANKIATKDWAYAFAQLFKFLPAVSDPTQIPVPVLCYDATDILITICAAYGVTARSVRAIAVNSQSPDPLGSGNALYLDHTFSEVWIAAWRRWIAQDAFFNAEFYLGGGGYPISADDLCGCAELFSDIVPKNKQVTGWSNIIGLQPIASQDFYAAIEHRNVGSVVMNRYRGDFSQIVRCPDNSLKPLGDAIMSSTLQPFPHLTEIG